MALNQILAISISLFFLLGVGQCAYAAPQSSHIVAGEVTIEKSRHHINITQHSDKAIVEWKNFNIGANDSVQIQQPKGGVMLIRVDPKEGKTRIDGKLLASGQVILVNQQGVYISPTSIVQVEMR